MGARTAKIGVRIRRRLAPPPSENTFRRHWKSDALYRLTYGTGNIDIMCYIYITHYINIV